MRISVIGCGYLGVVHAACLAKLGHAVVGVDTDKEKIQLLASGRAPFHEPGLSPLIRDGVDSGHLQFSSDPGGVHGATVHFICVGTPQTSHGNAADLSQLNAAFEELLPHLNPADVVVGKSTVPVGTAARLANRLAEVQPDASLVWNPEFLREGSAVNDTLRPDRLVYGLPNLDADHVRSTLDSVYLDQIQAGIPVLAMNYATAELVKVAANSFLATKVSFINAMAELCECTGADVTLLSEAIGHDDRIGPKYLEAGLGFGGGCLPKDIRAFMARADELGVDQALSFLREVDAINSRRRVRMVELARNTVGGSFTGRRIAVLGAAFKPDSDDVRDSPALDVAAQMRAEGADVVVTDPAALDNARNVWPDLKFAWSVNEALSGAELVLLLTAWQDYVTLNPKRVATLVAAKRILDGRNALDPVVWRRAGWHYRALGRP